MQFTFNCILQFYFAYQVWDRIAPGLASHFDSPYTIPAIAPRPLLILNGNILAHMYISMYMCVMCARLYNGDWMSVPLVWNDYNFLLHNIVNDLEDSHKVRYVK